MRFALSMRAVGCLLITCIAGMASIVLGQDVPPVVAAKCSICHPIPRATALPSPGWPNALNTMTSLMADANVPITKDELSEITAYYTRNSPPVLQQIPDNYEDSSLAFSRVSAGIVDVAERPQVTSLHFDDIDGDGAKDDLIVTDANLKSVSWLRLENGQYRETVVATIEGAVETTTFDFEGDGDIDIGVSSMGIIHPNEDLIGSFHLLLNNGKGEFEHRLLVDGTPRIAEAMAADMDADGDMDFVLAMFGWRYTGGIGYLEQQADGSFKYSQVLELNGCMRILKNDVNHDEFPDFIVMVAQQHEAILQFLNSGIGQFSAKFITRANHPAFGSSSINLADLDQDGDEDILYTNGDMMDENPEPKPYHGIRWLENDGAGNYELHYLAGMPGCYDAEAADMDGDGDMDVVFSSLNFFWDAHDFPSLAWLENRGGFRDVVPRRIAYAPTNLAKIALGDINGDGLIDIVGGGMHVPGPLGRKGRLTVWLRRPVLQQDDEPQE